MKKAIALGALLAFSYLQADNFVFLTEQPKPSYNAHSSSEPKSRVMLTPMGKEEMVMKSPSMSSNSTYLDTQTPIESSSASTMQMNHDAFKDGYWVQAGAFSKQKYAMERKARVSLMIKDVDIFEKDGYKRVVAGPFDTQTKATKYLKMIKEKFPDAFLTMKDSFQ